MTLDALLERWEAQLVVLRKHGASQAVSVETMITELRECAREAALRELTIQQAAERSGESPETVRKKIANGTYPNVGRKGRPRVRACDLPTKPTGKRSESDVAYLPDCILGEQSVR